MKHFVRSFPFFMIGGVCLHVACSDGISGSDTTGVGPVGAQGTGYSPACNLDRRDGYCNALGMDPETCECFDCVNTAFCNGRCQNDGACNYDEDTGEDCTCIDCAGMGNCMGDPSTNDSGPGPQQQSSSTGNTTQASTTQASTTQASTTQASTTTGGMGGQGGS